MALFFWTTIFILSLVILVKSADYFTKGAEIAGLKMKISPFIVGVTIVSIGTSLPELVTSFIAIFSDQAALVAANAIGSNIANILLVVGLASVIAGTLKVNRSLIDLDAPLLAISTAIFLAVVWDKQVVPLEAIVLIITYGIFVAYTIKTGQSQDDEIDREDKKIKKQVKERLDDPALPASVDMSHYRMLLYLLGGSIGVYFGANYVIESVVAIASILNIASSVIAITAIAFGTSLPELVVSIAAARKGAYEIALGNVFGSNIFNALMVIGLPGLFVTLPLDTATFEVGLFFMVTATLLYIFSGISKHIHKWEGLMYLMLYLLFVIKIFAGSL